MVATPATVNAVPDGGLMVTKLAFVLKVTTIPETSAPAASLTVAVAWVGSVVEPRAIVKVGVGAKVVVTVVPPVPPVPVVLLGVPLPQPARTMRVVVSKSDNENLEIFWLGKFCTRTSVYAMSAVSISLLT